jgi:uncharacterized delta-60 repeat protein
MNTHKAFLLLVMAVCTFALSSCGGSGKSEPQIPNNNNTNPMSGTLDDSFGVNGIVVASVNGKQAVARALGIQQDGKIVVAGGSYILGSNAYSNEELIVMRYNSDGTSDSNFGTGGKVSLSVNIGAQATALAVQPDGKIVVGGFVSSGANVYDWLVIRFNSDGSLDLGFGTAGKVVTSIIPHSVTDSMLGFWGSRAYILALQPDGKIMIGGNIYEGWTGGPGPDGSLPTGYALARYNANGSYDNRFGVNGIVLIRPDRISTIKAVAIQADGKLIVGGGSSGGGRYLPYIIRLNNDGTSDYTFKFTDVGTGITDRAVTSLAVQNDGKIVTILGGNTLNRYNSDGSIDTNFGNEGNVPSLYWYDWARKLLLIQNDGKIVVAASTINSADQIWSSDTPKELTLERYNSNGSLDIAFGSSGATMGLYGHNTNIFAITLQQDGKIVVA